jgi:hypothetical protein
MNCELRIGNGKIKDVLTRFWLKTLAILGLIYLGMGWVLERFFELLEKAASICWFCR